MRNWTEHGSSRLTAISDAGSTPAASTSLRPLARATARQANRLLSEPLSFACPGRRLSRRSFGAGGLSTLRSLWRASVRNNNPKQAKAVTPELRRRRMACRLSRNVAPYLGDGSAHGFAQAGDLGGRLGIVLKISERDPQKRNEDTDQKAGESGAQNNKGAFGE